jgi:tetratricopeptide (TPR) repeat protein
MRISGINVVICIVLAVATVGVYASVRTHQFVNIDDDEEIYENPHITHAAAGDLAWALTSREHANWLPLTRLSWMADWKVFGTWDGGRDWPGGHHLVDVGLHTASGLLLFLVLAWMTGQRWPSAAVAALFLLHPLHVESVAWAVERKDTLSGLFWMLTLGAYGWYVRRPGIGRYGLVVLALALGLMAKPMLVTLPLVLLLMDWWPLGRVRGGPASLVVAAQGSQGRKKGRAADRSGARPPAGKAADRGLPTFTVGRLLLEKAPMLALVAASCLMTVTAQGGSGAINAVSGLSYAQRLANALVAYVLYIGKAVVPMDMAIFYPYIQRSPKELTDVLVVAGAAAALIVVTLAVVRLGRRCPYLPVGWFWYLGTLVPVIGLVQVGAQAMADRYTYIPLIGIFVMVAWGAVDLASRLRLPPWLPAGVGGVAVVSFAMVTALQIPYWTDSKTLFQHALDVTQKNDMANQNMGLALFKEDQKEAAARYFAKAIEIRPAFAEAHHSLASILADQPGRLEAAMDHLRDAIKAKPEMVEAHNDLGVALYRSGKTDDAIAEFKITVAIRPGYADAHSNLGALYAVKGMTDDAIREYREAIRWKPDHIDARSHLADALAAQGNLAEAIEQYREVLRLRPDSPPVALLSLARLLATAPDAKLRDGPEAVRLAEKVCRLTDRKAAVALDTLAAAYAEVGRFPDAIAAAQEAIALADAQGNKQDVAALKARLALYELKQPFHMDSPKP